MAISGISSAVQNIPQPQVSPQQVNARRDSDGDNDGSRSGEVEKASPKVNLSSTATVGTQINTTA
jgi:hypothetical protein